MTVLGSVSGGVVAKGVVRSWQVNRTCFSPPLPSLVTGHFPAGRRYGPLRGAVLQGQLSLCPQQSCLPCDPRRGLPARHRPCHWPGEEQTGTPRPPGLPLGQNILSLLITYLHLPPGQAEPLRLASAPPAWCPAGPDLGSEEGHRSTLEGGVVLGMIPTAPRACAGVT